MKKRIVSVIIFVVISMFIIMGQTNTTRGYTATDENGLTWYYTVSNGGAYNVYVYSGTVTGDTLVIPDTLGGYPVVGIRGANTSTSSTNSYRQNILNKGAVYNSTITSIVIPDTVTSIGANTFCYLSGLQEVVIPNSVVSIDAYAFYNDYNLTSIELGNSVTTIGNYAFYGASRLKGKMSFPDSVTTIGYIFTSPIYGTISCTYVEELEIGSGLTTNVPYLLSTFDYVSNITISENNPSYLSEDGIVFNKDKTELIKCPRKKSAENYIVPSTVTSIAASAFYNCYNMTGNIVLPEGLLTIGSSAFRYCTGFTGNLTIPDSVTTLGESAFYGCTGFTGDLIIPNGITTINSSTFGNCTGLTGNLIIPEGITAIESSAFSGCTGFTGDLTIPSNVTTLGSSAFYNCTGFDGILTIENGLQKISSSAFYNCKNFSKTIIGNSVTSIESQAFYGFSDIWINNTESNVNVNSNFSGTNTYIHWQNDKHNVQIITAHGVNLINTSTNKIITSGDYDCETSFNYKIQIDDGYNYSNLKFVEINTQDYITKDVDETELYSFDRLLRDREIYVIDVNEGFDLSLRTFISGVNGSSLKESRTPVTNLSDGEFNYLHSKYPVAVDKDDYVTYTIRIYNEGTLSGTANKVSIYIPEGLQFVEENITNIRNEWEKDENGKFSTTILSNDTIDGYIVGKNLNYKDIKIVLKVLQEESNYSDFRLNVIAQIDESSDTDSDSVGGNITKGVESDYKENESYESNSLSYVKGQEDDDDFESVVVLKNVKVDYNIKVTNVDLGTNDNLTGAEFNLLDNEKNIIKTVIADENGIADFGGISTFGGGTDIYYVEESKAPEGYYVVDKYKVKVTVTKTITNKQNGEYSVSMSYEVTDWDVDTTQYEFIPVATAEQLQKIGTGETVSINGVDYVYSGTANYKLENDIYLTDIDWTPITYLYGVLDGDGHTIYDLTSTPTQTYSMKEIGLISLFSGVIQNLKLENVSIYAVPSGSTTATSKTGKTGIGAFCGVMLDGYIINCEVSGNIYAYADNVGGFVGHTMEGGLIRVKNCKNNANVNNLNLTSNVGGVIGCAKGPISIVDSENNGKINSTLYNAGGFVGYVDARYNKTIGTVNSSYDSENKTMTIIIGNGEGTLENTTSINNAEFRNCTNNGAVSTYIGSEENISTSSMNAGGIVGKSNWTVEMENCTNNARIYGLSKSGGFISELISYENSNCASKFTNCINNGEIASYGSSKIYYNGSVGGIISHAIGVVEVSECINNGNVSGKGQESAGGIIGCMNGTFTANNCKNYGTILSELDSSISNSSNNCSTGGIVGKNRPNSNEAPLTVESNVLQINNCENYGDISAPHHIGGIVGESNGNVLSIKNCTVTKKEDSDQKLKITDTGLGDKGGIVGLSSNTTVNIDSCNINEIILDRNNNAQNTYGGTAGIIGAISYSGSTVTIGGVIISNCNVKNSTIRSVYKEAGGIVGSELGSGNTATAISNCIVDKCEITNDITGGAYAGAAGIIAKNSGCAQTIINDCIVNECNISANFGNTNYDMDVAGIIGWSQSSTSVVIQNCDVKKSSLYCNANYGDLCANAGGIAGEVYTSSAIFNNCNVIDTDVNTTAGNLAGICAGIRMMNTGNATFNNCVLDNATLVSTSYTGSDSDTGGIVAVSQMNTSVTNCKLNNTNITGNGINTAGVIGVSFKELNVANVKISDTTIKSTAEGSLGSTTNREYGCVAGVASYTNSQKTQLSGIDIDNCTIEAELAANVAGIVGANTGYTLFNSCRVANSDIISHAEFAEVSNKSEFTTAGIIGTSGEVILYGCTVEKSNISGKGISVSGGVANNYNSISAYGCTIIDVNVKNVPEVIPSNNNNYSSYYRTLAGFIGMTKAGTLSNINVKNVSLTGPVETVGGLAGYIEKLQVLANCDVDNLTVEIDDIEDNGVTRSVGGIVGTVYSSSGIIKDSSISNSSLSYCNHIGAGAFGYLGSSAVVDSVIVDNVNIKNTNKNETTVKSSSAEVNGIAAGLVAISTNNNVLTNCTVKNSKIEIENGVEDECHTGGIVGFANGDLTISGATLLNTDIYNKTPDGVTGGIVGITYYKKAETTDTVKTSTIVNSTVAESNIIGRYHTGGIMGFGEILAGNDVINDIQVKGTEESADVGGIIGNTLQNSVIKDTTAKNILAEGTETVGGIIGLSKATITGTSVIDSNIVGTSTNSKVGGIAGHSSYEENVGAEDCTVENSTITAPKGIVGGIFGFSNSAPINSTVTGTEIKTTKGGVFGIL